MFALIILLVFCSYGKIQSVKFTDNEHGKAAIVAFMDIKSASKARCSDLKLDGCVLQTEYSEASGKIVYFSKNYDSDSQFRARNTPPSAVNRHSSKSG